MSLLGTIGATLTLPGIAGIILTVGMAVDANVLIFERIKEALRVEKNNLIAFDSGYTKSRTAILFLLADLDGLNFITETFSSTLYILLSSFSEDTTL